VIDTAVDSTSAEPSLRGNLVEVLVAMTLLRTVLAHEHDVGSLGRALTDRKAHH